MKNNIVLIACVSILLLAGCQSNETEYYLTPPITENNEPIVSDTQTEESSMFFEKAWADKFEGSEIKDDIFTTGDGTKVSVEMITKKMEILNTSENEYFDIIEVPYSDGTFSMTIFIPKDGISLDEAESMLTLRNLAKWDASLVKSVKEVALPGFVIDPGKELAIVESNEENTVVPSVTLKSSFDTFKMNRPFFFIIRPITSMSATNNSRSVVFTGKVGVAVRYGSLNSLWCRVV